MSTSVFPSDSSPSVLAISVVFGGGAGMSAAAAFGVDAGGGFLAGSSLVFLFLSVAVLITRKIEHADERVERLLTALADRRLSLDGD